MSVCVCVCVCGLVCPEWECPDRPVLIATVCPTGQERGFSATGRGT